ncbi:MAG: hypothetical protein A2X64_06270 [Ignavibacteria bacterium GWF2_33_9]|nr:MAG: hypothetical protein A2X64_06270 [Ignavibacteria bacterium GWF2_33_9]
MFQKVSTIILFALFAIYASPAQVLDWSVPVNLEKLNSQADEFAPVYYSPSRRLYFNSTRNNSSKFYFVEIKSTKDWIYDIKAPTLLTDDINKTSRNQSFLTFDNDGTAYFTSFNSSSEGSVLNIFRTIYNKNNWQRGQIVPSLQSDKFRFNPTISPSGNMMIFSQADPIKPEDSDLWLAFKNNLNEWIISMRLDNLNSNLAEITPYFTSNDTLYYSSNGFNGQGGYDIYYSININGEWQTPRPLNEINTEYDEMDFHPISANIAVFASNRPKGKGGLDLWASVIRNLEQNIENPELKLAVSSTDIDIKTNRKFILANNTFRELLNLNENQFSQMEENIIKIYADSFEINPEYLEITLFPTLTNNFKTLNIIYQTDNFRDSAQLKSSDNPSVSHLLFLNKIADKISITNILKISANISNEAGEIGVEQNVHIDIFNSTKEFPEIPKIGGTQYIPRFIALSDKFDDNELQSNTDMIQNIKKSFPIPKKIIVNLSQNLDQAQVNTVKTWLGKSLPNFKEIIYRENSFPELYKYKVNPQFNYILLLIEI